MMQTEIYAKNMLSLKHQQDNERCNQNSNLIGSKI